MSGDIVISKLGDPLGEACIVPETLKEGVIVADVVRVRPPEGILNRTAVTYMLNSQMIQQQFVALTKGTTRPRVNLVHIRSIRLLIPPVQEQRRIVEEIEKQFTRLEAGFAALKRVQANLKRYRAAVLKAAVDGRLVPAEAELARRDGRPYEPATELLKRILAERAPAGKLAKWPNSMPSANCQRTRNGNGHIGSLQCRIMGDLVMLPKGGSGLALGNLRGR